MSDNELLIVLTGESGSGKSYIQRDLLSKYPNVDIITKYTSRKSRIDENNVVDTIGNVPINEMRKMDYTYINPHNHEIYGFLKEDIDSSLQNKRIPCIAPSDEETYKKLLEDYPNKIVLLKIIPYYNEETMKDVFEKQGRTLSEFLERKQVLASPLTEWTENCHNMRKIINPYFTRSLSLEVSNDIIFTRLEFILDKELHQDLGASYSTGISKGIYDYLYYYSKNRPIDREFTISQKHFK